MFYILLYHFRSEANETWPAEARKSKPLKEILHHKIVLLIRQERLKLYFKRTVSRDFRHWNKNIYKLYLGVRTHMNTEQAKTVSRHISFWRLFTDFKGTIRRKKVIWCVYNFTVHTNGKNKKIKKIIGLTSG